MKRKNLTGILVLSSLIALIVVALIMNSQGEKVKGFYIQLSLSLMGTLVSLAGIYLIDVFKKEGKPLWRKLTFIGGATLALLSFLVCFNILNFLTTWNWLAAFGILYILLVQIQLLNWGNIVHVITRFSTLIVVLCDLFLVFFFIAKWHNYKFETYIELSAVLSIVFTFVGLIFLPKTKQVNS